MASRPFSKRQIEVASKNYENQVELIETLYNIYLQSGQTNSELAEKLEITESETEEWLHGEVDMGISQLTKLANALGFVIEYEVQTNKDYLDSLES